MKLICTTSDKYLHLLPVFNYLFTKYWPNQQYTIVGYDTPSCELPYTSKFESLGVQGTATEWSTDLRKYFEAQEDEWIIWLMEDTILKSVNEDALNVACSLMMPGVGRIGLTKDIQNREHTVTAGGVIYAHPKAKYRLSTQPSIWNKEFLLKYLTDGLSPWDFERQETQDDWQIVTTDPPAIRHNEGVTKRDIHKLDLNGLPEEDIKHIQSLL